MSRMSRKKKKKEIRKKIVYPIVIAFSLMFLFIIIADYRVNSMLGKSDKIRVINIINERKSLTIKVFQQYSFKLNTIFIKRDYYKIKKYVGLFINNTNVVIRKFLDKINNTFKIYLYVGCEKYP